jgi:very-short-patch-repair endonuclease
MVAPKLSSRRSALLAQRAHCMRRSPTWSERVLWHALSGKKVAAAFKRQVPVGGRFIVDFLAPAERVVVEVDGKYHARRSAADARRDRVLERLGYRVVRVSDELVRSDLPEAVRRIQDALADSR